MTKHKLLCRSLAAVTALCICSGTICMNIPDMKIGEIVYAQNYGVTYGDRIVVDLNANDGRKASYSRVANNWIVVGDTPTTVINGVTFKLSNGGSAGSSIRSVNCKILQKANGIQPYMTMDGVTIKDGDNGGVIKLEISGLSAGQHSLKMWHSCVDNASNSSLSVSVNGKTAATGVKCPTRVSKEDSAGISYAVFDVSAGQTVTVLIKPEGNGTMNNAWLNAFELDGADPVKSISNISPSDQNNHFEVENGLSWTAGSNAKSHDVYVGTDYSSVFNATRSSKEYKGNQTSSKYTLNDDYSSLNTYFWRVDEIDSDGNVVKGAVYSFKTARLAFPTAEGYGRFARGGRGGRIVEVTNLNDSGEGSLRQALEVETGPRIVVFRVGGVIELKSRICIPDTGGDVYVAGQTAPGDGITLINYDFGAMGSEDVIIRDIRTRVGDMNGKSTGGMGMSSCNNSIVDHCSISWATDEGFSSRSAQNLTFQWNIIGESLHESVHYDGDDRDKTETHAFAASISGNRGSFHHNLLIDCTGRNWSLAGAMEQDGVTYAGELDISNNVVYNWRDRTTDGGVRRLNFVNNYYKAGAESNENLHIVSLDGNELGTNDMQKMYVSGNMMVGYNGSTILKSTDNAWDKGKAVSGGKNSTVADVRSDTPFFESYVNVESAESAYKSVISKAGANKPGWDYIDSRYIDEVTNNKYTYTGSKQGLKGIIDSQNDVGGYPNSSNFKGGSAPTDSDHDGMPDEWEKARGLDPNNSSDGAIVSLSADDYTNVEMYLNELAGDPVEYNGTTVKQGEVMDTDVTYVFENSGSGLLLEVADSKAENGANVQQGSNGAFGWTLEEATDGYYYIYSELGDGKTYLLDLDYGKQDNGTNIGIYGNTSSDAQLFKFIKNDDGTYTIVTKSTEDASCIGIAAGSKDEGGNVVQWEIDDSDNQKWIPHIKLSGKLFDSVIVKDDEYGKLWSIGENAREGELLYGDRDVTYSEIPKELHGAEMLRTACDSKNSTGTLAIFTASKDMSVYVALDSRVTAVPQWLGDWEKTSLTALNNKDVSFVFYKKDFKAGETGILGNNGQSSGCVNYTVLAIEEKEETQPTTDNPENVVYGDANCSSSVDMDDVIAILCHCADESTNALTAEGKNNADVYQRGDGISSNDAVSVQKYLVLMIDSLPES